MEAESEWQQTKGSLKEKVAALQAAKEATERAKETQVAELEAKVAAMLEYSDTLEKSYAVLQVRTPYLLHCLLLIPRHSLRRAWRP